MADTETTHTNYDFRRSLHVKTKRGTLRKSHKLKSQSLDLGNVVTLNELFANSAPGVFGAPVIDIGSSYNQRPEEETVFDTANPILETQQEEDERMIVSSPENPVMRRKRWTTLGFYFKRKSVESGSDS
jgi:hypothetical protein